MTPLVTITSSHITLPELKTTNDLDTPDELAIRSLILGIVLRTLEDFTASRSFLTDAYDRHSEIVDSNWVGGVALFELAVLDLKEVEHREKAKATSDLNEMKAEWSQALKTSSERLDKALAISGSSVDLSSRLDGRINMLRDEILIKREMLGLRA